MCSHVCLAIRTPMQTLTDPSVLTFHAPTFCSPWLSSGRTLWILERPRRDDPGLQVPLLRDDKYVAALHCFMTKAHMEVSQKEGPLCGSPHHGDRGILGSILAPPAYRKKPSYELHINIDSRGVLRVDLRLYMGIVYEILDPINVSIRVPCPFGLPEMLTVAHMNLPYASEYSGRYDR